MAAPRNLGSYFGNVDLRTIELISREINVVGNLTQLVYGRVTDDRLTAASAVFSAAVGQTQDNRPA